MWFRSQDKERLVNAEDICYTEIIEDKVIKNKIYFKQRYAFNHTLGIYTSKEKALKVLDMIMKHINKNNNSVFQMPQDSEVE